MRSTWNDRSRNIVMSGRTRVTTVATPCRSFHVEPIHKAFVEILQVCLEIWWRSRRILARWFHVEPWTFNHASISLFSPGDRSSRPSARQKRGQQLHRWTRNSERSEIWSNSRIATGSLHPPQATIFRLRAKISNMTFRRDSLRPLFHVEREGLGDICFTWNHRRTL
jgi:hypothetical protein